MVASDCIWSSVTSCTSLRSLVRSVLGKAEGLDVVVITLLEVSVEGLVEKAHTFWPARWNVFHLRL